MQFFPISLKENADCYLFTTFKMSLSSITFKRPQIGLSHCMEGYTETWIFSTFLVPREPKYKIINNSVVKCGQNYQNF